MNLAGIILAAGASGRMQEPKALLSLGGESFLDRLIASFSRLFSPVVVVLGYDSERIRAGLQRAREAEIVLNPDFALGQLTSLQCGLRALPAPVDGCFFIPVDCPRVRPASLATLVAAFARESPPAPLVIPRYQGQRGHPVGCARALFAEFLALPADSQARVVVHRHSANACYVDVDDPAILDDVDTPEDYRRLLAAGEA